MDCSAITPISAFQSTNLTSRINSFSRLGDRITRTLGAPMVNIEIHQDQLFEFIAQACEMFTKYAGFTEEYLVFDSNLYDNNVGLKLDNLFSISGEFNRVTPPYASTVYACTTAIPGSFFSSSPTLSSYFASGLFPNQILTTTDYLSVLNFNSSIAPYFNASSTPQVSAQNTFDYDTTDYRKVVDVYNFETGSSDGVNTLFTIEQTLAQQTYFSYAMGNYGFDLISWYTLKNWLEVRDKLLAQRQSFTFDPRTQILVLYPPPKTGSRYWATVACYVERPLKDVIKEPWVFQYALALSKIAVGNVRGKYANTTLFGGGSINASDFKSEGLQEKKDLEEKLFTGAATGFGDANPPMFFIG